MEVGHVASRDLDQRRRWRRILAAASVAVVLSGGVITTTAVWATHDFPDVPASSPFHDDVSWVADNDITTGFVDGTYRPKDDVSRGSMAAFMRRLSAKTELYAGTLAFSGETSFGVFIYCPSGMRPVAGSGGTDTDGLAITASEPYADPGGVGWFLWFESISGAARSGTAFVYVTCVPGL